MAASEVVAFVERVLKGMDLQYAHGMEGCPLEGSSLASEDSWFSEVGHQHAHDTYLKLVGAPLVPLESNAPKTQAS